MELWEKNGEKSRNEHSETYQRESTLKSFPCEVWFRRHILPAECLSVCEWGEKPEIPQDVQPYSCWKATVDPLTERLWWLGTLWIGINGMLITHSNDQVFFLACPAGKTQVKNITSVWSVWSSFPLLCSEIIVSDYLKRSIFHKLALSCHYEDIFIKRSLSGSDKEEAISSLFWGIRYL